MKAIYRMSRNTLHVKTERWSMVSECTITEWFGSEKTFKGHLSNRPAMNLHHQTSLHVCPSCFFPYFCCCCIPPGLVSDDAIEMFSKLRKLSHTVNSSC